LALTNGDQSPGGAPGIALIQMEQFNQ